MFGLDGEFCQQDQDVIREFLVESHENLSRLDQELVELEKRPGDAALLASIFRTIHTIKGTCGFLSFATLERISHQAETLLAQLRSGQRELTPALVSLILQTVDATRQVLASIEATGNEGTEGFAELTERLRVAAQMESEPEAGPVADSAPKAVVAEQAAPATGSEVMPPPAEPKPAEDDAAKPSAVADANIRVAVGLLDKLMDLVGELVLTRNQILQFNVEREDPALNTTSQRLDLITTELQEGVMKTRLQPIGMVWSKLPRVVRDIAVALDKQICLEMDGAGTELDRTIIEAIKDPLIHLVRNACDHGIEAPEYRMSVNKPPQGTLTLRAYHEGGQVNIEIGDDGAGIDVARVKQKAIERGLLRSDQAGGLSDREALNLIFQPGFSLAPTLSNISGRGVGMDVVKSHIEKIGGVVDVLTRLGEGTTIRIKIPLTLAIIPGLVIASGGERFVIPQVSLVELIRLDGDSPEKHIEHVQGTPVHRRRGILLPLAYLNQVLGLKAAGRDEPVSIVVVQAEDRQFGLVVDGINDTQEIVVKPLSKQLKGLNIYAGATIMGDGRVALILDVLGIGQRSGVLAKSRERHHAAAEQKTTAANDQQRLLLFRAGSFERLAVPLSLVARLEEFPRSAIERAGGGDVVQYRDRILPLVPLGAILEAGEGGPRDTGDPADPVQVVVFSDGDRNVGLVVDQILDVAEEAVTVRQKTTRRGLLGSAVVGKLVTDFLDLNEILHGARQSWCADTGSHPGVRILLIEASAFSRGLIRSGLDMAGYQVIEAAGSEEAIRNLDHHVVDAIVTAVDLPGDGNLKLLAALRRRPEWEDIPVLGLRDTGDPVTVADGYRECQSKFDRVAMLESLVRLSAALAPAEAVLAGEQR